MRRTAYHEDWARHADLAHSDRELAIIQLWLVIEICLRRLLEAQDEHLPFDVSAMQMARALRSLGELTDEDLLCWKGGFGHKTWPCMGFGLRAIKCRRQDFSTLPRSSAQGQASRWPGPSG
jgi:hypothetical protein